MTATTERPTVPAARGLERLAGAILVQAIEDISSGAGKSATDAWRWIQDGDKELLSFTCCCRLLNRDPDRVRRMLKDAAVHGVANLTVLSE